MVYDIRKGAGIKLTGALGVSKVDQSHTRRVLEHSNVTCGTSAANIVSGSWDTIEGHGGTVLTSYSVATVRIQSRERLAIGQHGNVTCKTFAHATSVNQ